MTRKDCINYHCEHYMGASIDCCILKGLGNCSCSNDCNDYVNKNEIYRLGLEVFRQRGEQIDAIPTIEQERKKGKWIKRSGTINCSICKHSHWSECFEDTVMSFNYCPNCGADMRGGEDEV